MKPFFNADDFNFNFLAEREVAAEKANAKLQREGVVVYGWGLNDGAGWEKFREKNQTHKGILINIEEIEKKCSHERSISKLVDDGTECRSVCVRCGVPMLATWNEVKLMSREEYILWYLRLLEMEVEALRSVLAEIDGDKLEYTQMVKAENIAALKNSLVRP